MRYAIFLWLILAWTFSATAAPVGIVTLLEGKGSLNRGAARYALQEGIRLEKGDILELAEKSSAQVEFNNGAAIALAAHARIMLSSSLAKGESESYLLQGQLKLTTPNAYRVSTPAIAVTAVDATLVMQGDSQGVALFAERGEAKVDELFFGGARKPRMVQTGEFYSRKPEQKGELAGRPSPVFVSGLPKPFLDNLPSQYEKFKERKVEPKRMEDFTYADVEPWLKTTPAVRKALVPRWRMKARDPAFRKALIANLKDHPEWDRVLFPEKYSEAARKIKVQ